MGNTRSWSRLLRRRTVSLAGGLAVALAAIELLVDHNTRIHLNVSIVYSIPLVLAAVARSRRLLWSLTAILGTATFIVYSVQIAPGAFGLHEPFFVNRVLSAVTLLLWAACCTRGWERSMCSMRSGARFASATSSSRH